MDIPVKREALVKKSLLNRGTLTTVITQDMARDGKTGKYQKSEGELEQCVILVFTNISSLGIRDCYYICVLLN